MNCYRRLSVKTYTKALFILIVKLRCGPNVEHVLRCGAVWKSWVKNGTTWILRSEILTFRKIYDVHNMNTMWNYLCTGCRMSLVTKFDLCVHGNYYNL